MQVTRNATIHGLGPMVLLLAWHLTCIWSKEAFLKGQGSHLAARPGMLLHVSCRKRSDLSSLWAFEEQLWSGQEG